MAENSTSHRLLGEVSCFASWPTLKAQRRIPMDNFMHPLTITIQHVSFKVFFHIRASNSAHVITVDVEDVQSEEQGVLIQGTTRVTRKNEHDISSDEETWQKPGPKITTSLTGRGNLFQSTFFKTRCFDLMIRVFSTSKVSRALKSKWYF